MGADAEVFRTVDALYTAVTARDEKLLAQCEARLSSLKQASKLPESASSYLDGVIATALEIAEEQQQLRARGEERIEGNRVYERLMAGASATPKAAPAPKAKPTLKSASGRDVAQIVADTRAKGLTITINPKGGASVDEILDAIRPALVAAKFNK